MKKLLIILVLINFALNSFSQVIANFTPNGDGNNDIVK